MERTYQTARVRGLDWEHPAMRLWDKGKRYGTWNPAEIDFTRDVEDWDTLSELERTVLLHLSILFQVGEESVTLDLLPLIRVIAEEGRLEEEMYLSSFLFEEAKHVEAFQRFFERVVGGDRDLSEFLLPNYKKLFCEELPGALSRLADDPSPEAQASASVTYNLVVEGMLAETGYHGYAIMLEQNGILPAMQEVITLLKRDESRHIAYGMHLLTRLVKEHGEPVRTTIETRCAELLPLGLAMIDEVFEAYEELPFGLEKNLFLGYATSQFQGRLETLRNVSV